MCADSNTVHGPILIGPFFLIRGFSFLALLTAVSQAEAAWQASQIKVYDQSNNYVPVPALRQSLKYPGSELTLPFGLAQMDNGQVALVASAYFGGGAEQPVIAFSNDLGNSWSNFQPLPGPLNAGGRPLSFTHLGGNNLSYLSGGQRYFSNDYGQSWSESVITPPWTNGQPMGFEGNAAVDFDANGHAARVTEIGYYFAPGQVWPTDPWTPALVRHSNDGGRTWQGEVEPQTWKFFDTYNFQAYERGVSEGSVVRAANGSLVAALRTDMPARFFAGGGSYDDSLEGLGVSISNDNGLSWSPVNVLFDAGRHHANLQRMPNGDLVMTMVVRDDIRSGGELDTHKRGSDALISHDNGLTWNVNQRISIDEFDYFNPSSWYDGKTGHVGSTVLSDGAMLSVYGKYTNGTAVLTKWNPSSIPSPPLRTTGFNENWDSRYVGDGVRLRSPWVHASVGSSQTVWARNLGAAHSLTLSGDFCVSQSGGPTGEAATSRQTGVGLSDTSVEAIASFNGDTGTQGFAVLALSSSPVAGDRWRDQPGSLVLMWTPSYGVELFSVNSAGTNTRYAFPGLLQAPQMGSNYVQFRFSTPNASGAQTASVDWKMASDSTWTNISTVPLDSTFAASNLGLVFHGGLWGDDVSISSIGSPTYYDYNDNGVVDVADYVVWRKTLNQSVSPETGADGSGNGIVGNEDYLLWRSQFGTVVPGAGSLVTSVPDPASGVLLIGGSLALLVVRRPNPSTASRRR